MQTSIVFSQRTWTGVGDLDDCWVLSAMQCANVVAPWVHLPSSDVFRRAAGDPDDGKADGGRISEIIDGVVGTWPEFKGQLDALRGVSWTRFRAELEAGRPVSVALTLGKLPKRLQHTTSNVPHQSTVVVKGSGRALFANPMAQMGARWDDIDLVDVRSAILDYGNGKVFGVAFPTDDAMAPFYPPVAAIIDREAQRRCKAEIDAARAAGFGQAKAKSLAAVNGIQPG